MCRLGIPDGIDKETATIALILNVFLPGIGTLIVSFAARPCSTKTAAVAFAQVLLLPVLVGWIWAVTWAYLLLRKAQDDAAYAASHPRQLFDNHPVPPPPPVAKQ